jgi:pimeloyl-ACP methyl ester carboxylesterase
MCQNPDRGRRLAELTGGEFVLLEGSGHLPNARDPVVINLLLRDFVRRVTGVTA